MRRVLAILACGFTVAGCASGSDALKSATPTTTLQFESEPAGAEVKTSTGQTCKTPCALAVPAADLMASYTLKGYKPQTVPVVTLLVSPQDAATLTMASTEGKIQLALRNTIDVNNPAPVPVLQAAVFSPTGAPQKMEQTTDRKIAVKAPAPAPPPYSIEIIVGDKRETKSFPNSNSGATK